MDLITAIAASLSATLKRPVRIETSQSVSGGSINSALSLETTAGRFFIKINKAHLADMFAAEADGLEALKSTDAMKVPRVIALGTHAGFSWLAMEFMDLGGPAHPARFGEALARLHLQRGDTFGWQRNNTIGSTPQCNTPHADWVEFWRHCRLGPQLEFAHRDGAPRALIAAGERLYEALPAFFTDYRPEPSLLHGDLWSGNWGFERTGEPVLFDPAVYYGDRETDIAMTGLFGSPGREFYAAYDAAWPLDPGYQVRTTLYNLYHILNHHHLFGGGYATQAQRMLAVLLAELEA